MIEINLLPKGFHKKSLDFSLGKSGMYVAAGVVGVLVMLIAVTFYQKHQISSLDDNIARARQRAAMLQKDIAFVDALTDVKDKITHRMKAVEKLDGHRSIWVRLLGDLARNVPDFVWLSKFSEKPPEAAAKKSDKKDKNDKAAKKETMVARADPSQPTIKQAQVEGFAFTLNALASFMIKMMRSDYFDEVELVSTNEVELQEQKAYNFVLTFNVHYLSDEDLRNKIAMAQAAADAKDQQTGHKRLN
ncbi:MAG: PilN domain-containing protein [candidate division Zixibacteria bacterium]|nr:PilN domain-containing protein [candidate division Zixibacteria bacterium]